MWSILTAKKINNTVVSCSRNPSQESFLLLSHENTSTLIAGGKKSEHEGVKMFVSEQDEFESRTNSHESRDFWSVNAVLCMIENFFAFNSKKKKPTVIMLIAKGQVNTFGQIIMGAK